MKRSIRFSILFIIGGTIGLFGVNILHVDLAPCIILMCLGEISGIVTAHVLGDKEK